MRIPITGGISTAGLTGTATLRYGSTVMTLSSSQTLVNGQGVFFDLTSDPSGQAYEILPATLFGTVNVINGSPTITFLYSQTLLTGQTMNFGTGAGVVYTLGTGGTGTTFSLTANFTGTSSGATSCTLEMTSNIFTISPAFNGINTSSATATSTAWLNLFALSGVAWVTGPNTFVMTSESTVFSTGLLTKRVNSTDEITIDPTLAEVCDQRHYRRQLLYVLRPHGRTTGMQSMGVRHAAHVGRLSPGHRRSDRRSNAG